MRALGMFLGFTLLAIGAGGCVGADDSESDGEIGTATSALLNASSTTVSFGGVPVRCTATQSVLITNGSTSTATITSVTSSNSRFSTGTFPGSLGGLASASLS